jgi:phosphonate transport system substrate-binding protein
MNRRLPQLLAATFGFAFSFSFIPAVAQAPATRLVVALKPDKNPDAMREERQRLSSWLAAQLGRPVEVVVPLSAAVITEGLASGTIDLAYLSATEMWVAKKRSAAEVLLAGEIAGRTSYESWWVTLREKPYQSVAELAGKPVAFASRTSTSGFLVPVSDLVARGLLPQAGDPERFFGTGNVFYGTGYVSAVERVLSGQAEAAAVSYYVLAEDKHLTPEQRARLKKLQAQGPVPTHVLAVRSSLPASERDTLRAALLRLNTPEFAELRDRVFTSALREVNETEHLAAIATALAAAGKE